jgi:hypothetical protein
VTRPIAIVVGFIGKLPMAGMTLYNLHYIAGLQDLGYDVHYVERQNGPQDYYNPEQNVMTAEIDYGIAYTKSILETFGIGAKRTSVIDADQGCRESGWQALNGAISDAAFILDLADATWFDELDRCPRRAFVDGDPLFTQAAMLNEGDVAMKIANYNTLFTYCTRMGKPDCLVPDAGRQWIPTRPVVCTRLWTVELPENPASLPVSNLMNWSAGAEIELGGRKFAQKGPELERFIDMPSLAGDTFVLAIGGPAPRDRLREHGWTLTDPIAVTRTLDSYRDFIIESRADFGIAKHAYVASRSGWFSDRSVCYLASGRPVMHQDTGFSEWLPVGEGVFSFSTPNDVLAALSELGGNYAQHVNSARRIAEEHFEAKKVIGQMLDTAGFR